MARFNFKELYHAATIQGRLDFEGGIYRDGHAHVYRFNNKHICMHVHRRSSFNCEYLLIANCEYFLRSQLIDSQT